MPAAEGESAVRFDDVAGAVDGVAAAAPEAAP
jgi:hypothetical protein